MKKLGYILGLLSGLFWAITSILYGYFEASTFLSISTVFFIDFLGFAISGMYLLFKQKKIDFQAKGLIFCFISGILGGPLGMLCYLSAIEQIGSIPTSSISITYPIFGTFFSFLFLKEKINKLGILGLVIAVICLILFVNIGSDEKSIYQQITILGFFFAFTTAISWGGEIISSSYAMRYYDGTVVYFFRQISSSIGYASILLYLLYSNDTHTSEINYTILTAIIISSILSYFLYYQAIYLIKPIKAMALNITYGAWSIILSILFLEQKIDYKVIILCMGILMGSALTILDKKDE